jgi:hypothetical protein
MSPKTDSTTSSDTLPATTDDKALPAVVDIPAGNVLALPTDDPWASVDTGFVGDDRAREVTPIVPRLMFNANKGYGFVDELNGEPIGEGETITVSWLAWSESRAWWEGEFGAKGASSQPDCRSLNMVVPDEGVPNRQAETCAACPHSKWEGDDGPTCGVRINVLLWLVAVNGEPLPDGGRITRTAFRGIALKHVRRYLGFFASKGVKLPPMAHLTTIEVAAEATGFGDKLVPHFRIGERVPFDQARPLLAARDEFLAEWRSQLADDLAQPDAGGDVVPREIVDADSSAKTDGYGADEEPF